MAKSRPGIDAGSDTDSVDRIDHVGTWFRTRLIAIAVGGFALRVGYVLIFRWHQPLRGDEIFYVFQADALADGHGFNNPLAGFGQNQYRVNPNPATADHPPLTQIVLAPVAWITHHHVLAMRLTMTVVGVAVIIVVALLARRIAGPRVGIVAGLLTALYPQFWVGDGVAMSEPLAILGTAVTLYFAYRLIQKPCRRWAVLMGFGIAFASLARGELVILGLFVAIPAVWLAVGIGWQRKLALLAVAGVVTAFLLAPWIAFNLVRFQKATWLSTNDGLALVGGNCAPAYYGKSIGTWTLMCVPSPPAGDASVVESVYRHDGLHYARHHPSRALLAATARVGRVWSVYAPLQNARYGEGEGRPNWASYLSLAMYYPVAVAAIGGAFILRRRRVPISPLLGVVAVVTIIAFAVQGLQRSRVPAEGSLLVLAAVAVVELYEHRRSEREPVTQTAG